MNQQVWIKPMCQVYVLLTCLRVVLLQRCRRVDCKLSPWVGWLPCSANRCGEEGDTLGWKRVIQRPLCGGESCGPRLVLKPCITQCTTTQGTTREITNELFTTTNVWMSATQETGPVEYQEEPEEESDAVQNVSRRHMGTWVGVGTGAACILVSVTVCTIFLLRRRLNSKADAEIIRPIDGATDGTWSTSEAIGCAPRYSKLESTYTYPDNQDVYVIPENPLKSGDSIYAVPAEPRRYVDSIYVLAADPDIPDHMEVPPSYKNWDGIQRKPVLMVSSVEYEGTDTGDEDECYEDTSHLGLGGTTTMVENDIYEAADRCAGPDCDAASLATDQSQQMYDTDTVMVENEIYQSGST